jgi:hypothetical protein
VSLTSTKHTGNCENHHHIWPIKTQAYNQGLNWDFELGGGNTTQNQWFSMELFSSDHTPQSGFKVG